MERYTVAAPFIGALGLIISFFVFLHVRKQPNGDAGMQELETTIHTGAIIFLKKEFMVLCLFLAVVFLFSGFFIHWNTALAFLSGAFCSMLAGLAGLLAGLRGHFRTAAAVNTPNQTTALTMSYFSGSVMGLSLAGLGLLGLGVWFWVLGGNPETARYINGFALGASASALLARIGGGIFTTAAKASIDQVRQIEVGIPEDDPRNPGVITQNVGANIGPGIGVGTDIFESYVGSVVATLAIGATLVITPEFFERFPALQDLNPAAIKLKYMAAPIFLVAAGLVSSIFGIFSIRFFKDRNRAAALRSTTFVTTVLFAVLAVIIVFALKMPWVTLGAIFAGLLAGIVIGLLTEYYTSHQLAKRMASQSTAGPATVIISGLVLGMKSTCLPVLVICMAIFIGHQAAGVYGIGLAAVGMLATAGSTMTVNACGPIIDNADRIFRMAEPGWEARSTMDIPGNTTKATGTGFAIGSAALTALALLFAFTQAAGLTALPSSLSNPYVIIGILLGGMAPMLCAGLTMASVRKATKRIVDEIRRQFRDIPGLLEGREGARPDTAACVAMATTAALKKTIAPALIAVLTPVAAGFFLGKEGLMGVLLGTIIMGVFLALFMSNGGLVWENARKWIEQGNLGGQGSDNHRAVMAGDTIGDLFKDTAAPTMNTLIKFMSVVSLVMAPILPAAGVWWRL